MDWLNLRFELFQALDCFPIHDIYLAEVDNKVLTLLIVADDAEKLRPLTQMRIMDSMIERKYPQIYRRYLFCYILKDRKEWTPVFKEQALRGQRLALKNYSSCM